MISDPLCDEDKAILLRLARQTIELVSSNMQPPVIDINQYSKHLQAFGASFVTLTRNGELRGCIGALEPYQPLVQDVCEHAASAATEDFRFSPVRMEEVPLLTIEISRLTPPQPLIYTDPLELPERLCPGIDGIVLVDGNRRATFLPQVWEKIPDRTDFLSHLCLKMGVSQSMWQRKILQVFTYQVEEFREA